MADSLMGDMVRVTTTTTGTSDLTIGSTVTGFRNLSAAFATGDSFYYTVFGVDGAGNPSGEWETGIGTYNTTGTTRLIRDHVIASSNSNAAVSFSAGTKHIICSANVGAIQPDATNEFRLSLSTATPVTSADVTGASVVYLTPYKGNLLTLYTGTGMRRVRSSELSVTLSGLTSAKVYDVILYYNASGVLKLDLMPAWTNDTTRSSGLTPKMGSATAGLWVNTSSFTSVINGDTVAANKATHVGTIYTTGTTTTEDSNAKRFVWNRFNRLPRPMKVMEATTTWNYTTAAWRALNGSTSNRVQWVRGDVDEPIQITVYAGASANALAAGGIGIGLDSTTAISGFPSIVVGNGSTAYVMGTAYFNGFPTVATLGFHYASALEYGMAGGSFYGTTTLINSGIMGIVWG